MVSSHNIVEFSTVKYRYYNTPGVKEEEESSCLCVEREVPRELLLHREQLMPPLEIVFERFEENIGKYSRVIVLVERN